MEGSSNNLNNYHEMPHQTRRRLESELYGALGKLVVVFSRLDLNVGLCLAGILYPQDSIEAKRRLDGKSTHQKLMLLCRALDAKHLNVGDRAEVEDWFDQVAKVKELRNNFVHGRWGVRPLDAKIHWMKGGILPLTTEHSDERQFSLEEFLAVITTVEALDRAFWKLREKHKWV